MHPGDFVSRLRGRSIIMAIGTTSRWCGSTVSTFRLVALFDSRIPEDYQDEVQPVTQPRRRCARALRQRPCCRSDYASQSHNSPVFNYPYARTREALHALTRGRSAGPAHRLPDALRQPGRRRLGDADDGDHDPPVAQGIHHPAYRSSDSAVFVVVEGRGRLQLGDERFELSPHDVVVVPGG